MATVGLVSCVSRKRAQATDAQDLYESPLFLKARDYGKSRVFCLMLGHDNHAWSNPN